MVSVLIPAHNERKNLESLVPYLKHLKHGNDNEIVIASSFSDSDGYEDLKDKYHVSVLKCQGKGRALQMNAAAQLAKGDVLAFLHADVKPPVSFFDDIKTSIIDGYDAGFFSYQFDKDDFFLKINASFTTKDGLFTGGGDQCLFIKRNVFDNMDGFDEKQVIMEDFEFFKRMKSNKIPYKIVKSDLVVSSRKYENNSYLRVNITNFLLVVLFKFGYSPENLKKLHNTLLRLPYQHNTSRT
ncbi:glycosyltransferase [Croceitalea rosinachiae]|uniref:Glycosyltransferase n=1 Tax=Croceitalea rosinachiae TaxID=3075596 RepID=A0ABU3AAA9_9FLAO|nr:glycosyltransferase [Croceitalea sp. F388]MDT0607114.1 glycosyltransferase [Croceitalea sp. F388]